MSDVILWIGVSLALGIFIGRVVIRLSGHQRSQSQDRSGASRLLATLGPRNVFTNTVQGLIVGCALALISFLIIAHAYVTKVNGWTTMFGCGEPDSGLVLRAACNAIFQGPINTPQEAMYWLTKVDGANHRLSGHHNYVMHFAAGQLPPTNAFWSLTMGTARNRFVPNPINRYSVGDRSGLVPNPDGSLDIYIQNTAPAGHEANWLPAPPDKFLLWLRVYLPGASILDGKYNVPPVVETQ